MCLFSIIYRNLLDNAVIMLKESKKKTILNEAIKLFVKKGFVETSMRDLANSLDMQPSSLYNHFKSKDEILETICHDVRVRFQKIRTDLNTANLDPHIKFHQLLRRYVQEMLVDEFAFDIYVKYSNYSEKNRKEYAEGQAIFIAWLTELVNQVHTQLKPKVLIGNASVLMMIYSLHVLPKIIIDKENVDIDAVVQDFYNTMLYGILDNPNS